MNSVALAVNGQIYSGWTRISVTRTMEALAGSFELSSFDKWADGQLPWPILEEDVCTVILNGQNLMTGWVDKRTLEYDEGSHGFTVSGRDASGALVDNSAQLTSWHFANVSVLDVAQSLAARFGVGVSLDPSAAGATVSLTTGKRGKSTGTGSAGKRAGLKVPTAPSRVTVAPGETAFIVLDRLCKAAGLVPISDGVGNIVLTRGGAKAATGSLIEGENIKALAATFDASQRFATYIVIGQRAGSNQLNGASASAIKQSVTDPTVKRTNRTTWIRANGSISQESALARAAWERGVRQARGTRIEIIVAGWTQPDGSIWPVNAIVLVQAPHAGINGSMLITSVTSTVDDSGGLISRITVCPPNAFVPEPVVTPDLTPMGWQELKGGV